MKASEFRSKYCTKASSDKPLSASEYQAQHQGKTREKAVKIPKATANQITTAAILWLNLNGFKAYRNNNGGVFDPQKQIFRKNKNLLKGVPDIVGFQKGTGRALYIEVKAGKDKLSTEQIIFLEEAEKGGAIVGVIRASQEIEIVIKSYLKAA